MVASGLADGIHRSTLTVGYLLHMLYSLLIYEQAHALLRLVGYDFLSREGLVAYRQFAHVYESATLLHEL